VLDGLHPRVDGDVVDGVHYLLFVDGSQIWSEVLEAVDDATERADRFMARFRPIAFPEVEAVLAELHDRYRLALVTNSPRAADDVEALGFGRFFDHAIAIPPELRKPRPEGFWYACEALGVEPADLVYVGDSYRCDVEAGLAAGVRPVWVDRWNTKLPVPEGVTRITSLAALPSVLP
jgi:putative hydrolase of the HAD superfamily